MTAPLRLLHTSDWHIGMTRRHLTDASRAIFLNSRLDAVEKLCDIATTEQVDGVIVAGDIFDSPQLAPSVVLPLLELLGDVPCPVVLVPGNHDPYHYESVYRSTAFLEHQPDNVHVAEQSAVLDVIPQCELVVGPFTDRFPTENPIFTSTRNLPDESATPYRVVVGHGSVNTFAPEMNEVDNAEVVDVAALEKLLATKNVDYVALGDRHSTTSVGDSGRIWYSGSPETTDFDDVEKASGNALLVELDGDSCEVTQVKTGEWRFTTLHGEVRSLEDLHALDAQLQKLPKKHKHAVRIGLKAYVPVSVMAEVENYVHKWGTMFAGFHLWERHSEQRTLPDEQDLDDYVSGYAKAAAEKLLEQAEAGDETATNALTLLYRLATERGAAS